MDLHNEIQHLFKEKGLRSWCLFQMLTEPRIMICFSPDTRSQYLSEVLAFVWYWQPIVLKLERPRFQQHYPKEKRLPT